MPLGLRSYRLPHGFPRWVLGPTYKSAPDLVAAAYGTHCLKLMPLPRIVQDTHWPKTTSHTLPYSIQLNRFVFHQYDMWRSPHLIRHSRQPEYLQSIKGYWERLVVRQPRTEILPAVPEGTGLLVNRNSSKTLNRCPDLLHHAGKG